MSDEEDWPDYPCPNCGLGGVPEGVYCLSCGIEGIIPWTSES